MTLLLAHLLTFVLYGALSLYFWQATWKSVPPAGIPPARQRILILVPLLLHAGLLYQSLFAPPTLNLTLANALSAILWLTVLIYWITSFRYNLEGLPALVLPFAAVAVLLPLLLPAPHPLPYAELPAFKVHFLIAMLAYSLFTIAAMHALLMAVVERSLHQRALPNLLQNLPPLLTMERLLFRIIGGGFVLLTLTLASGMLFSEELFQKPLQFNHKNLFGIISWLVFAALLGGRVVYGWRGRTAIRWTLSGFILLLLAYVGTKFVLEIVLHR